MARYQINTQTANLYPDGLQQDFIIQNTGPGTVFLDHDTSISADTSFALAPNGSIVWTAGKPLYARSSSTAYLLMVPNQQLSSDSAFGYTKLAQFGAKLDGFYSDDFFLETHAFETVQVQVTQNEFFPAVGNFATVPVAWYGSEAASADDTQYLLSQENLHGWTGGDSSAATYPTTFTIPVLGPKVNLAAACFGSNMTGMRIYGTQRKLGRSIQTYPGLFFEADLSDRNYGQIASWDGTACYLNNVGRRTSIFIRINSSATTSAGDLRVQRCVDGAILHRMDIPTGLAAGKHVYDELIVPDGTAVYIVATLPSGPPSLGLSVEVIE